MSNFKYFSKPNLFSFSAYQNFYISELLMIPISLDNWSFTLVSFIMINWNDYVKYNTAKISILRLKL